MPSSPAPSTVQIHYHSGWGPHVQTLPTTQWDSAIGAHGFGGYTNWAGAAVEADDMINALVNLFAVISQTEIVWDNAVIFNAYVGTILVPVRGVTLTQVGAVTHSTDDIAQQTQYTAYDTAFHTAKLVLLDSEHSIGAFKQSYASLNAAHKAVFDAWSSTAWAWSSRFGARPASLRSVTQKRNDKLRREYRLS